MGIESGKKWSKNNQALGRKSWFLSKVGTHAAYSRVNEKSVVMKSNKGLFLRCCFLVLFGIQGPYSHASEEDCPQTIRKVFENIPAPVAKDETLGEIPAEIKRGGSLFPALPFEVMRRLPADSYKEMQWVVARLNDIVEEFSDKLSPISYEEMQNVADLLNETGEVHRYIYRVRTTPTMGFEVVPVPVVFETVFEIHNTNHIKLVPKAGDKNFSISLVKTEDTPFPLFNKFAPIPTIEAEVRGKSSIIAQKIKEAPSDLHDGLLPIWRTTDQYQDQETFLNKSVITKLAYHYKIVFTHDNVPTKLNLIIPANSQGYQNLDKLENMEFVLRNLPSIALKEVNSITIYPPSVDQGNIASFAPLDKSIILNAPEILHNPSRKTMLEIFQHEVGHAMAWAYYDSMSPNRRWERAIDVDNTMVSPYGETDISEDFAEAMRAYLATEGGLQDPVRQRKILFHRFKILDEILQVDTRQLDEVVLE